MTNVAIFLTGVGATTVASLTVVIYLQPHLKSILTDLCGTAERAKFWAVFSHVTLMLIPLIFAMSYHPEVGPESAAIFEIGALLKWALIGLASTVILLGIVLGSFIPRSRPGGETRTAS